MVATRDALSAVAGRGLHTGRPSVVRFEAQPGPLTIRQGDVERPLSELLVAASERSTELTTSDGRLRVRTVEHVLAALAGLGVRSGVRIVVEGPEMPLADGGALAFTDAIAVLGVASSPPSQIVARAGEVVVGASRYVFTPAGEIEVAVSVDFGDARVHQHARWDGRASTFLSTIAQARTFAFAREVDELAARGLASHVAPESVVVIAEDGALSAGRAFSWDEPARHKLLDLVGDLHAHGGPPIGSVYAERPGHAATHEALRRARAEGVVVQVR